MAEREKETWSDETEPKEATARASKIGEVGGSKRVKLKVQSKRNRRAFEEESKSNRRQRHYGRNLPLLHKKHGRRWINQ